MVVSGNKITNFRKKCKFSQEELADLVGVSQSVISNWESGQSQPPLKHIDLLAKELGVNVEELLDEPLVSIYHQHGESGSSSINGNNNTIYAENRQLTEELLATQRKMIASLEKEISRIQARNEELEGKAIIREDL